MTTAVTIHVRLFARARDLAGTDRVTLSLPGAVTVADVRRALAETYPRLADLLLRCAIAFREEFADDRLSLPDGAEVAVLPPVSGGEPS
jgi:molybdopterin converting factor subunit 1